MDKDRARQTWGWTRTGLDEHGDGQGQGWMSMGMDKDRARQAWGWTRTGLNRHGDGQGKG